MFALQLFMGVMLLQQNKKCSRRHVNYRVVLRKQTIGLSTGGLAESNRIWVEKNCLWGNNLRPGWRPSSPLELFIIVQFMG